MSVWARLKRDERGISAVVLAVSLFALFGASMLAVDAGNLWQTRRNMVTATDASALAQARQFALSTTPAAGSCASTTWSTQLLANAGSAQDLACTVVSATGGTGVVVVEGRKRSNSIVGGVLNIGDQFAFSMSAAIWGYVNLPVHLRPIGLCLNDGHVQDYLNPGATPHAAGAPAGDYAAPDGTGLVHHILIDTGTSPCGDVAGHWAWMDYDLEPPVSENEVADRLANGWDGWPLELEADMTGDCNATTTEDPDDDDPDELCTGDTGVKNSNDIREALDDLVDATDGNPNDGDKDPAIFQIVIYDVTGEQGANATFNLRTVVSVKLWDYKMTPAGQMFFDFQFVDSIVQGICCGGATDPSNNTNVGFRLCGQDHDPLDPLVLGARCTFSS